MAINGLDEKILLQMMRRDHKMPASVWEKLKINYKIWGALFTHFNMVQLRNDPKASLKSLQRKVEGNSSSAPYSWVPGQETIWVCLDIRYIPAIAI